MYLFHVRVVVVSVSHREDTEVEDAEFRRSHGQQQQQKKSFFFHFYIDKERIKSTLFLERKQFGRSWAESRGRRNLPNVKKLSRRKKGERNIAATPPTDEEEQDEQNKKISLSIFRFCVYFNESKKKKKKMKQAL